MAPIIILENISFICIAFLSVKKPHLGNSCDHRICAAKVFSGLCNMTKVSLRMVDRGVIILNTLLCICNLVLSLGCS